MTGAYLNFLEVLILSKYCCPAAYRHCCPADAHNSLLAWEKHRH